MIIIIIQLLLLYNDSDTVKYILKANVSTGRRHCQVSIQTNKQYGKSSWRDES